MHFKKVTDKKESTDSGVFFLFDKMKSLDVLIEGCKRLKKELGATKCQNQKKKLKKLK